MNYFAVGQNTAEFVLDFGQCHADRDEPQLHTRIVTSPVYAKLLSRMLIGAVERYESDHGTIDMAEDDLDPLEVVHQSVDGYDHVLRSLTHRRGDKP